MKKEKKKCFIKGRRKTITGVVNQKKNPGRACVCSVWIITNPLEEEKKKKIINPIIYLLLLLTYRAPLVVLKNII